MICCRFSGTKSFWSNITGMKIVLLCMHMAVFEPRHCNSWNAQWWNKARDVAEWKNFTIFNNITNIIFLSMFDLLIGNVWGCCLVVKVFVTICLYFARSLLRALQHCSLLRQSPNWVQRSVTKHRVLRAGEGHQITKQITSPTFQVIQCIKGIEELPWERMAAKYLLELMSGLSRPWRMPITQPQPNYHSWIREGDGEVSLLPAQ